MKSLFNSLLIALLIGFCWSINSTVKGQTTNSRYIKQYLNKDFNPIRGKETPKFYCFKPINNTGKFKYYKADNHTLIRTENRINNQLQSSTHYYINGNKEMFSEYKNDKRVKGTSYHFNGAKIFEAKYVYKEKVKYQEKIYDTHYLQVWDTLGNLILKKGTGRFNDFYNNGKLKDEGTYKKHKKNGTWKGYSPEGILEYSEEYKKGELVQGKSFADNKIFEYTKLKAATKPKGGFDALYKYISETLKYPASAKRTGTEGKVYVQLVINKVGKPINIEVVRGIGNGCDEVAIETIKSYPLGWTVAEERGQPIDQRLVIPINFNLGPK